MVQGSFHLCMQEVLCLVASQLFHGDVNVIPVTSLLNTDGQIDVSYL